MNRWTKIIPMIVIVAFVIISCSKGTGSAVSPEIANSPNEGTILSQDQRVSSGSKNSLLGYYDIYFDPTEGTFEAVENRTAGFTLNMVPLLNNMSLPLNGITFENIVLNADTPGILGVDVDFRIYHPAPTMDRYFVYDVIGVIIGDGDQTLKYENLSVARRGTDLWMKNADGYTRWFNPTEFTAENIFGYVPGGFQNYAGDATVNPYKYYAKDLEPGENVWEFLSGPNVTESRFHTGNSRTMELEFVLPSNGLGIRFGYAVVFCWEEQGIGPYSPYHRNEVIAMSITLTDDIYYDGVVSGGDLILDIELFAWENQPDILWIESTVLQNVEQFDATAIGQPVSEHISTYHIEIPAIPIYLEDHEVWVIAESNDYDYSNNTGFPHADGPLAAFFRYNFTIADQPYNHLPVIHEIYDDVSGQGNGHLEFVNDGTSMPITYFVDYTDAEGDPCSVSWYCTVKDVPINVPADLVATMPSCQMDWLSPDYGFGEWDLYARVNDGNGYSQDKITITVNNPPVVDGVNGIPCAQSNGVSQYSVDVSDPDGTLTFTYDWTVALSGGGEVTFTEISDGVIEIDWAAVGAVNLQEYTIDCDVSDGYETVSADTLTVLIYDLPSAIYNLPLREGFDAMDIAVDHADGDLLVLYSDGAVWRYTEAEGYNDGTHFYSTYEPGSQSIDIAPNSYSIVAFYEYNAADIVKIYDGSGDIINTVNIGGSACWARDVIAFTGHTYTNMLGITTFSCPGGTYFRWRMNGPPDYDSNTYFYANLDLNEGCGSDRFERDSRISAECGNIDMEWVYYLENNPSCPEYQVQRVYRQGGTTLINEAMWGGVHTDDMDGFWDPKDITRDYDNDFYILDHLSTGEPLIKKYTDTGDPIGSFGDSSTISGIPLRIEGSDYGAPCNNNIFVIHRGATSDLLSIFYPSDIPD